MKNTRKWLSLLLALALILALLPQAALAADSSGTCGDNLTWTFKESTGELTISGTGKMTDWHSSLPPWLNNAEENTTIKTVTIKDGVTSIGMTAFYRCTGLTSVTIPDSVTSIGNYAFHSCSGLTSVAIPDGVTIIGYATFYGCSSLTSVTIPDGVISIIEGAFGNCSGLTSVTIPDSVTEIDYAAFSGCTGLTSVTIPKNVTFIGDKAFGQCTSLTSINVDSGNTSFCSENGVLFNKDKTKPIEYPAGKTGHYQIPDGVTSIYYAAFSYTGLTSVTIPESVTRIEARAFLGCTDLTTTTILNQDCKIDEDSETLGDPAVTTIRGYKGSTAEAYAKKFGYKFEVYDPCSGGHDFGAWTTSKAPTCAQAGQETRTCSRCGETETRSVAALGHAFGAWTSVKAPTCTETGQDGRSCSRCGASQTKSVAALGHDYQAAVTAPTCTVAGFTAHTCSRCGDSYRDGETPALGHDYKDGFCTRCGEKDPDAEQPITLNNPFVDVLEGAYYYDPVLWAVNREPQITNGTDPTHFSPDKTCTRAQVVTFLWRAMGCPEPTLTLNPFADVKPDQYYYKAVLWAVQNSITNGTSSNTFSPDKGCTRAQVVTFLWRTEGKPDAASLDNPFTDVPAGQYYTEPVLWAVEKEITKGTSADRFSPDSTCTRAQIVTFLYRDMK